MTDGVGNLVLEQLRILRGEVADLRGEMNDHFKSVDQRLDSFGHGVSGVTYFLAETHGELLAHDERITKLEEA